MGGVLSRHCCVPKIALPEARKCKCTMATQDRDPEIRALSLVRGECTTALYNRLARETVAGGGEEKEKERKERLRYLKTDPQPRGEEKMKTIPQKDPKPFE